MFMELDPNQIIIIFCAIFVGGFVKGLIGFGFPLVSLPLLSFIFSPVISVLLLFIPVMVTNLRELKIKNWLTYKEHYPLYVGVLMGIILGSNLFHNMRFAVINILIGILVILVSFVNLYEVKINKTLLVSKKFSFSYGFIAGGLGGMTAVLGPTIVAYLSSLKLKKKIFAELVSLIFFLALIPFYTVFFLYETVTYFDLLASALALIPAISAQSIGLYLRSKVPENLFKKSILIILIFIGILVMYKNIFLN